jgi:hypothetical protein
LIGWALRRGQHPEVEGKTMNRKILNGKQVKAFKHENYKYKYKNEVKQKHFALTHILWFMKNSSQVLQKHHEIALYLKASCVLSKEESL